MRQPPTAEGSSPVLVLIHGIGMSHRSFSRLARALRSAFRLVALDLPGFGGARSPHRALGVEGQAAAAAAALRALGLRSCVIVGQSMGTQVAVELARTNPELVSAVVLIGPVVDARRPSLARQAAVLLGDTLGERPSMNAIVVADYLRSVPQFLRELRPMLDYPMLERVAELAIPVLVVRGDRDPIARHDWATRLASTAVAGHLVEPRGPHHVQEHAPGPVAAAITDFIARHRDARP